MTSGSHSSPRPSAATAQPFTSRVAVLAGLCAVLWAAATPSAAHVVLEQPVAVAGQPFKAVLRISHGCEGAPTHTVEVQIPAGFAGAKPMPKAGWSVTALREPLPKPTTAHGRTVTEDVVRITWAARSREAWLADDQFDEFTLRGQAPPQPGAVWFKVRQLCEKAELSWAELPAAGESTKGLKAPAVLLKVVPAQAAEASAPHH